MLLLSQVSKRYGYGQPILTGIGLDDIALILQGTIPAAPLALLVQGLFELIERGLPPRGLRLRASEAKSAHLKDNRMRERADGAARLIVKRLMRRNST
jgi:hypothetical protein